MFKAHLASEISSLCRLQSWCFFLPPSAAMLCPALLCAALLLLTPVEITDARALQQPSDAAQVGRLGGGWRRGDYWEGEQEGIRREE